MMLIDRANSLLFHAVICWVLMVVPQTPDHIKVTLAISSVVLMRQSGKALDEVKTIKTSPKNKVVKKFTKIM